MLSDFAQSLACSAAVHFDKSFSISQLEAVVDEDVDAQDVLLELENAKCLQRNVKGDDEEEFFQLCWCPLAPTYATRAQLRRHSGASRRDALMALVAGGGGYEAVRQAASACRNNNDAAAMDDALWTATWHNRGVAIRALIACGANVDAVDGIGFSALHKAAETGHVRAINVLLQAGANVDLASYGEFDEES